MNEVEPIANDDKRQLVLKASFLKEVLDLLWVVVVALATNALDFPDLASAGSSLDILEVYLGILAQVDDGAQVVVETFEALERLEHLDELDGA